MKKRLMTVLLIVILLLAMAGCSAANTRQSLDAAEDIAESRLDAVEEKLESSLRKAVSPAPPVPMLTEEQALQIALDDLGITADQITRLYTEYETDDGVPRFDIEFHRGDWEYEYEINAGNGQIISYDKDHKHD